MGARGDAGRVNRLRLLSPVASLLLIGCVDPPLMSETTSSATMPPSTMPYDPSQGGGATGYATGGPDDTGEPIMLLVAQSATQSGILQIHRPDFCYTAGGYDLSPSEAHNVALLGLTLPALSISATRDARSELIVYWTRIGNHMPQRIAAATV